MKKNIIGFKELRENAEVYIREIEKGRSFIVMRRSTPIFKITPVDEWGDQGVWDSAIDLTKVRKGGVPVRELLEQLHTTDGSRPKVSR